MANRNQQTYPFFWLSVRRWSRENGPSAKVDAGPIVHHAVLTRRAGVAQGFTPGSLMDTRVHDRRPLANPARASQWGFPAGIVAPAAPSNEPVTMQRLTVFTSQSSLPSSVPEAGKVQRLHPCTATPMIAQNPGRPLRAVSVTRRCRVRKPGRDRQSPRPRSLSGPASTIPRRGSRRTSMRQWRRISAITGAGEPKVLYLQQRVDMRPYESMGFVRRLHGRGSWRLLWVRRIEGSMEGPGSNGLEAAALAGLVFVMRHIHHGNLEFSSCDVIYTFLRDGLSPKGLSRRSSSSKVCRI
jgi:hypothetical protein